MTLDELKKCFESYEDEFLKFDRIVNPLNHRPDVCAFLMIDAVLPSPRSVDMVSAAEHDEIYLEADVEELAAVATEELVRDLYRCGVRYDTGLDCLAMFV